MLRLRPVATPFTDSLALARAPVCVRGFVVPDGFVASRFALQDLSRPLPERHVVSPSSVTKTLQSARRGTPHCLTLMLTAAQIARRARRKLTSAITLPPLHAAYACALRLTLLSSQEVAARSAYARSKPG